LAETRVGGPPVERRGALAVTGSPRVVCVVGGDALLAILAEEGVTLRQAAPGEARFVRDDLPDWPRVEARLAAAGAALREEGEVTVVGPGVGSDARVIARALAAAAPTLGFSASPLRLTVHVATERVDEVTRALHAALL
jgi:hypothetical protein